MSNRFYRTAKTRFVDDNISVIPEDLIKEVVAKKDAQTGQAINSVDLLSDQLSKINFIDVERNQERVAQIRDRYNSEIDAIAQEIYKDPSKARDYQLRIRQLQKNYLTDKNTGEIYQIEKDFANYQKDLTAEAFKKDPATAQMVLSKRLQAYSEGDNDTRYKSGEIYARPDLSSKEFQDIFKQKKEDVKVAYKNGRYITTKEITEQDITNIALNELMSDPTFQPFLQQMVGLGYDEYANPFVAAIKDEEGNPILDEQGNEIMGLNPENPFYRDIQSVANTFSKSETEIKESQAFNQAMTDKRKAEENEKERQHALALEKVKQQNALNKEYYKAFLEVNGDKIYNPDINLKGSIFDPENISKYATNNNMTPQEAFQALAQQNGTTPQQVMANGEKFAQSMTDISVLQTGTESIATQEEIKNSFGQFTELFRKKMSGNAYDEMEYAKLKEQFGPLVMKHGIGILQAYGKTPEEALEIYKNNPDEIINLLGKAYDSRYVEGKRKYLNDTQVRDNGNVSIGQPMSFFPDNKTYISYEENQKVLADINGIEKVKDFFENDVQSSISEFLAKTMKTDVNFVGLDPKDPRTIEYLNAFDLASQSVPPTILPAGQTVTTPSGTERSDMGIKVNSLFTEKDATAALNRIKNEVGVNSIAELVSKGYMKASMLHAGDGSQTILLTASSPALEGELDMDDGTDITSFKVKINNSNVEYKYNMDDPKEMELYLTSTVPHYAYIKQQTDANIRAEQAKNANQYNQYKSVNFNQVKVPAFNNLIFETKIVEAKKDENGKIVEPSKIIVKGKTLTTPVKTYEYTVPEEHYVIETTSPNGEVIKGELNKKNALDMFLAKQVVNLKEFQTLNSGGQ